MATGESKQADKTKTPGKITFRCQVCGQDKLLEEMRLITRFFPVLVLCSDCEKTIR